MTPPLAPNGGEIVSLAERLDAATTPAEWQEVWLKEWDEWRSYIATGGMGSWPRDCFEGLLDNWQEDRDRIEALELELAQVEAVNLDMTARMDRISTGALYADLTTRATSAELTVTALRERLEGMEAALRKAIKIADEAREEWDKAPSEMRAGKILIALSGGCPGYRSDTDDIHAILAKGSSQ